MPRAINEDEWLTVEEVVARCKLDSRDTLYGMRSRGRGPRGYKVGRELRFKSSEIDSWMEQRADPDEVEAA
jgi:excisionase family DNA binding protein